MALNGNSSLFSIQYLVNINSIGHHSDYEKGLGLFVLYIIVKKQLWYSETHFFSAVCRNMWGYGRRRL